MKLNAKTAARAAVSIGLIALLLYIMRDKYGQILSALKSTDPVILAGGFLVFLAALSLAAYRLQLIIRAQDIPTTFPDAYALTFIGYFFNNFLPTSIGGDIVKAYYVSRKASEKTTSYTAVFVDRAIGLVTMVFMAFVAILLAGSHVVEGKIRNVIFIITFLSALGIFFLIHEGFAKKFSFLLALVRPIEDKLRKIYAAINRYRHHRMLMFQSLIISIASQLLYFASIGIVAMSIGCRISIGDILLRMPIVSAVSLLPSINGLGVREGATVLFFGPLIGKENAFAVSILLLMILFATSIIGGLVYMISPQFKITMKDAIREGGVDDDR